MDGRGDGRMIRILPADQAGDEAPPAPRGYEADPLAWAPHRYFMPSGRAAIDAVLRTLALEPADEILITNTTGQTYVSSCVTSIVFNHCQPSRVFTERTRGIVAIHEFGHPHPGIGELRDEADRRGIPLIEDCAHSVDSSLDGMPLGSFGDFAVFSLSKVVPIAAGGILVGARPMARIDADGGDAERAFDAYRAALREYSYRRRRNYDAVRQAFPDIPALLPDSPDVTPWYVDLLLAGASDVRRSSVIEWGATLRDDLLLVTTNPFVGDDALVAALQEALSAAGADPRQG